jgi:O-antigen ligase
MNKVNYSILIEDLNLTFLFLIVFTLPFSILLNSYLIGGFVLLWIASGNFSSKYQKLKNQPLVYLFISLFIIRVFALFFIDNIEVGLFQLEKQLSLFLFPVILGSIKIRKEIIHKLLIVFAISTILATLICIVHAIINFSGNFELFYLNELTRPVQFHYIYFALYVAFSILILGIILEKHKLKARYKILLIFLILYLIFFLVLLSAKMVIAAFFVASLVYILQIIIRKGSFKYLAVMIGFTILLSLFLYSLPATRQRIETVFISNPAYNPLSLRLIHWKCTWEIVTQKPFYLIFGVGAGNDQKFLNACFEKEKYWAHRFSYNAHSQFFQTLLNSGLIGLFLLILIFSIPIYFAFKNNSIFYIVFLILFALSSLTESTLTVQKGVVFYSLFNSLFAFHYLYSVKFNNNRV